MEHELLHGLTPSQAEAVVHRDGPLLILAGPGSGKTRVVTHRIAHLITQGVPPQQIVALTFTNKAADEMRSRLARLVQSDAVWLGTFHRFCSQLLRLYAPLVGLDERFTIYDSQDSSKTLKQVIDEQDIDIRHFTVSGIASVISNAKNRIQTPEAFAKTARQPIHDVTAEIYPLYQQRLAASNAVDFDDLLMHIARLLRENSEIRTELDDRFRYLLVDEYQDTNLAQYMIVRSLSINHPNLAVTGDPDQSIYGWRGANINNILEFERDFPGVQMVRLEQNYRSTPEILRAADALIINNRQRKKKALFTANAAGQKVRLIQYATERDEADGIASSIRLAVEAGEAHLRDFAVLYRTNALSRAVEHALRNNGIAYQIVKGLEFYQRKEIKDVLAYLRLIHNPRDENALLRVINTPTRGIGKTTLAHISQHARTHNRSLLEAARESGIISGLTKRATLAVARFMTQFDAICVTAARPIEEIVAMVLSVTQYTNRLGDSEEDQQRLANIQELLTAAKQFDEQHPYDGGLERFLEQTALVNDTDDWEYEDDRVTLITLHGAKGLEFPSVFVIAMEQGILPHQRSIEHPEQMEEERRLLFVGMTRAEKLLQLTYTKKRAYRGSERQAVPSHFLMELPKNEMQVSVLDDHSHRAQPHDEYDECDECVDEDWECEPWDERLRGRTAPGNNQDSRDPVHEDNLPGNTNPATANQLETSSGLANLTTAADLMPETDPDDPNRRATRHHLPGEFRMGQVVRDNQRRLGRVMAIGGSGKDRTATVRFVSGEQQRYVLAYCDLQILHAGDT